MGIHRRMSRRDIVVYFIYMPYFMCELFLNLKNIGLYDFNDIIVVVSCKQGDGCNVRLN